MDNKLIREIAIAGHWRAADPTAEIYITDFDLKNLRVWTVMPMPLLDWREWPVRVQPMGDTTFNEINEALKDGYAHALGTNLGTNTNGNEMTVRALVSREGRQGRSWVDSLDLPLPANI